VHDVRSRCGESSILKLETAGSFEALLTIFQVTRCHIPRVKTVLSWMSHMFMGVKYEALMAVDLIR
jgi:hypothetical protein